MPLTQFICPDGGKIACGECLKTAGCRMGAGNRCCTLPTLRLMASERVWKGKPSTTQLIRGTMEAFLKIKHPYAVSPDDSAFRLAGTLHHGQLEKFSAPVEFSEEEFADDSMTGIADLLTESEVTPGRYDLTDYKNKGSYPTMIALGGMKETPVIGSDGSPILLRSGPNKGKPKVIKEVYYDPIKSDCFEEALQLNRYRIWFEQAGFPIDRMAIQITVRDGGLRVARESGVTRKIYMVPIRRMPDEEVLEYFKKKHDDLIKAVAQGSWDKPCSDRESWDGRKCSAFCSVAEYCPNGKGRHNDE